MTIGNALTSSEREWTQQLSASARVAKLSSGTIAYRTFGDGSPLILLQRFRATMLDWDPAFLRALAARRKVIIFDSAGVGESGGTVPVTLEGAADIAAEFIGLELGKADVLGWSMGGMSAQVLAIKHPGRVNGLVLAGTLPPGGSPEVIPSSPEWSTIAGKPEYTDEDILELFFTKSEASRVAGRASLARLSDNDRPGSAVKTTPEVMRAQLGAIIGFYKNEGNWYGRLGEIVAATLVANGDSDGAFPVIDSVVLAREIPGAELAIYPDAGHAFHFQAPERVANDITSFLHRRAASETDGVER